MDNNPLTRLTMREALMHPWLGDLKMDIVRLDTIALGIIL